MSRELLLSRIFNMATALPSLLVNISTFNCIYQRYCGRPIQKAILISTALSMIVDVSIIYSMGSWLYDNKWPLWGPVTVGLNILKRIYSIVPVYVIFLRLTAICDTCRTWTPRAGVYTAGYALLAGASTALHLHAYITGDWVSAQAWAQYSYKWYRGVDVAAVFWYASVALVSDVAFISLSRTNPHISARFDNILQFYNPVIGLGEELVMLVAVLIPLVLGIFNTKIASAPYTEQALLSFITLNAVYSVKATAVLRGDTDDLIVTVASGIGGGTRTVYLAPAPREASAATASADKFGFKASVPAAAGTTSQRSGPMTSRGTATASMVSSVQQSQSQLQQSQPSSPTNAAPISKAVGLRLQIPGTAAVPYPPPSPTVLSSPVNRGPASPVPPTASYSSSYPGYGSNIPAYYGGDASVSRSSSTGSSYVPNANAAPPRKASMGVVPAMTGGMVQFGPPPPAARSMARY
ncbi:hypothetical protein GGF31_001368 [Allomyces arbusculus]|nr:hypothetical protein GGF31_001368 [Allomyces arbusculus]